MITVLRKLLQLLATCSPPRITVWASPSLAVAAVLPCQQLEVANNIIPWSSWPFLVLVRSGWQHPSLIILTFWTFLILFWGGQQYHLLILFSIHFILFVVLYFLRPTTSSLFSLAFPNLVWIRLATSSFFADSVETEHCTTFYCSCVYRHNNSHISHIYRHKCHVHHQGDQSNPVHSESK